VLAVVHGIIVVGVLLLAAASVLPGCNSCDQRKKGTERPGAGVAWSECTRAEDCVDLDPCREMDCVDARCRPHLLPEGTPCGEATACQSAPWCSAEGRCVAGDPVEVDDANPCTMDSCDPTRGVRHDPIDVDDGDACTTDACDPSTGQITHESVDLDDGDECTFDACNPETGVSHARAELTYTCAPTCGSGYHVASRRRSPSCPLLQSVCQPDCGASFYTCEASCPPGYQAGTRELNDQCGRDQSLTFCHQGVP